jgi:uncharacterized protein YcnI
MEVFMNHVYRAAALAALLTALGGTAGAHVTLEASTAPANSTYKAVLRVGHGCDGAATTKIRVRVPLGVRQAKPMPKPGWELKTAIEKLPEPYDWYGTMITEEVREIEWSGGKLPDAFYDEFVFRARLPDEAGAVISFPVVQECETGVHRWIEIPEPGKTADDYEEPAPQLTLTPKQAE